MRVLMSVTSWDSVRLQSDLISMGFRVTVADDGIAIFEALDLISHPVVLMETDLPDLKWQIALDQLRSEAPQMTILVVNSADTAEDRLRAFELGADDVVSPQVDGAELAARICSIAARRAGHASPTLQIGPLQLALQQRKVWWSGTPLRLTPTQYQIFEALCLASPRAVSKHDLMGEIYGVEEGSEERIIDVFITTMRDRLQEAGAPRDLIETVRGRGYRLSEIILADAAQASNAPFEMPVEDFGIPATMHVAA